MIVDGPHSQILASHNAVRAMMAFVYWLRSTVRGYAIRCPFGVTLSELVDAWDWLLPAWGDSRPIGFRGHVGMGLRRVIDYPPLTMSGTRAPWTACFRTPHCG